MSKIIFFIFEQAIVNKSFSLLLNSFIDFIVIINKLSLEIISEKFLLEAKKEEKIEFGKKRGEGGGICNEIENNQKLYNNINFIVVDM